MAIIKIVIYIFINVNYLHKVNGGLTLKNAICNSEKQDSPFSTGSKSTVCLRLKQKYREYLKALLFWTVSPRKYLTFPSPIS